MKTLIFAIILLILTILCGHFAFKYAHMTDIYGRELTKLDYVLSSRFHKYLTLSLYYWSFFLIYLIGTGVLFISLI